MSLSTSPRSSQCVLVSSRSSSRPSCARPSGHCVSGSVGVERTVRAAPPHAPPPVPLHPGRGRRGGVQRPFALPIRRNAVGLSSAKSVGMQSRVAPMFAIEP
jgi:hypothetical protein